MAYGQLVIPALEDYVCTFQCQTHCPFPDSDCIWDDPTYPLDIYEYPKFYFWRVEHGVKHLDDWNASDLEPDRIRCLRCHSVDVTVGYPDIVCEVCNYTEPLIDYPASELFYQLLEDMAKPN